MKFTKLHEWDISLQNAKRIQQKLRDTILIPDSTVPVSTIAGADVSYSRKYNHFFAAVVVLSYPKLEIKEIKCVHGTVDFPYVPGYLTFREAPLLLQVFEKIETKPDVLICDGQGIAHPLRMGIATHLGLWLDIPTIGCAKSRLTGTHSIPDIEKSSFSYLYDEQDIIGAVVRTRKNVKPVYVSIGHLINLQQAVEIVLACAIKYRLPEPTRLAHIKANQQRLQFGNSIGHDNF